MSSAGRRDWLTLHANEPDKIERFKKCAADVKAGKMPAALVAREFGMSEKTLGRIIERLDSRDRAAATYAPISQWKHIPGIEEFETWLASHMKISGQKQTIASIERIWETVWEKKALQLLTRDDFVKAAAWIKEQPRGVQFGMMFAVRSLVRKGYGDHSYLTDFLGTRRLKTAPSMPPEISVLETFVTVIPRLFEAFNVLEMKSLISSRENEDMQLIVNTKRTLWIRSGDPKTQKELWGTKLNAGQTHLDLSGDSILHWSVFAKWDERWEIPRNMMAPAIRTQTEEYIRSRHLQAGQSLVQLDYAKACRILREANAVAKFSTSLIFHDFRKMGLTAACLAGVPLEVAVDFGVGWKDINTARKHYLTIKHLNSEAEFAKMTTFLGLQS